MYTLELRVKYKYWTAKDDIKKNPASAPLWQVIISKWEVIYYE